MTIGTPARVDVTVDGVNESGTVTTATAPDTSTVVVDVPNTSIVVPAAPRVWLVFGGLIIQTANGAGQAGFQVYDDTVGAVAAFELDDLPGGIVGDVTERQLLVETSWAWPLGAHAMHLQLVIVPDAGYAPGDPALSVHVPNTPSQPTYLRATTRWPGYGDE